MVPKPLPDELLSSWLIRTAIKHQTQPATFMNLHFPEIKPNFWSRDVDIFYGAQQDFLEKLSYKSYLPFNTLYQMTLQSYTGFLSEKIHVNTRNNLITSIKNRGRNNHNKGLRYCPKCLAEDNEPFFRKQWRLSFVTVCPKHNCFLENICPTCQMPVTPYKVKEINMYCRCHYCETQLWNNTPKPIYDHSNYLLAQENILHILDTGIFPYKSESYHSLAYFPVLKQISKIIKQLIIQNKSLYVEDMPIVDQYNIYSFSESLLRDDIKMKMFCQKNHLGKGQLQKDMGYIPYWYTKIIFQNDNSFYSASTEEIKSAIRYLKKHTNTVSLNSLSKLMGTYLSKKKRPDISGLLEKVHM